MGPLCGAVSRSLEGKARFQLRSLEEFVCVSNRVEEKEEQQPRRRRRRVRLASAAV